MKQSDRELYEKYANILIRELSKCADLLGSDDETANLKANKIAKDLAIVIKNLGDVEVKIHNISDLELQGFDEN